MTLKVSTPHLLIAAATGILRPVLIPIQVIQICKKAIANKQLLRPYVKEQADETSSKT